VALILLIFNNNDVTFFASLPGDNFLQVSNFSTYDVAD